MKKILLQGEIPVNGYILEEDGKCFIIDPGSQKNRLIDYVESKKLEVVGILLTHGHFDHIGALDVFDVPVYLHKNELELIADVRINGFVHYGMEMPYDMSAIKLVPIQDGDKIKLGEKEIEVILTPGHTAGSVCYKLDDDIFSGDTVFAGSVGRWDFPTGDPEMLKKSVVALIDSYPDNVKIHPGHGESTTIAEEKRANQFYRGWKTGLDLF